MLLNQIEDGDNPSRRSAGGAEIRRISGGSEGEFGLNIRLGPAVRASGTAGLGASAERLVDNGLDGARASAAFGAAAEAAVDLLGIARKVFRGADGVADIVVAEDVAGTDNHENGSALR